jgi:uncharacterized YkwD family protein
MNKQHNKGLKKSFLIGTLVLALSIPVGAGAASAASTTGYESLTITQLTSRLGIDLNALLQQYIQGNELVVSKPAAGTGNNDSTQVAQPSKPVTQPSKPVTKPSKPVTQPSKPVTQPSKPVTEPSKPVTQPNQGNSSTDTVTPTSSYATEVVTLVNQERAKAGLAALKMSNATLTKMALDKAKDMDSKGYFDHNSPTYGSPFDMMKQYGISYRYAGENIAKGQRTPQEVMTAWMNSPGHRANILSANFTTIGVAYYNGVWVQEFIA